MLLLSNVAGTAPQKVSIITGQTCTLDIHGSAMDISGTTVTPVAPQDFSMTSATTQDIIPAPASGVIRNVKLIHCFNKHASSPVDVTVVKNDNGTSRLLFKCTLVAGAALVYNEAVGSFYVIQPGLASVLYKALAADDTGGQNVATAQPWFPTQGAVTVAADTTYLMDGRLMISRAAGSTSHTTSLLFGGTATLTSIAYMAKVQVGDTMALLPLSRVQSAVATATVIKAASTSTTEQITVDFEGIVRVNAGGTLIPQFQYSSAPGGTPTILKGSRLMLTPIGNGSVVSQGTWS